MAHSKGGKALPVNRIGRFLHEPDPDSVWKTYFMSSNLTFTTSFEAPRCGQGEWIARTLPATSKPNPQASDWAQNAQALLEKLRLESRVDLAERQIQNLTDLVARIEGLCEKALHSAVSVPIHTFAPDPFEVVSPFCAVVQPEEDSFVATLFDANISSSGDTQEEAIANLKDLILMIFRGFEEEDDTTLGPAMIRQKHVLSNLIRRK